MKTSKMQNGVRAILLFCAAALIAVLFLPMWRIELQAPQYPEGLMLLIYPDKLSGNVAIINGLNHYIGMKTLHTDDFMEFKILPYIIGFFAVAFLTVAAIGKRKWLYILCIVFVCFGILAMYDFWRWEYNYGHHLNPDAAIIVPGMAYQPPLIGFKQLLNFGAYSIPDKGGWIFIGVGVLLLVSVIMEWKNAKKLKLKLSTAAAVIILILTFSSCNTGPEKITAGIDNCYSCKMTVTDDKFGAELVTAKGKVYKFDDVHCIVAFLQTKIIEPANIKNIYLVDFCRPHDLLNVNKLFLLKSEAFRSPMGGNIAAFNDKDSLLQTQQWFPGSIVNWNEVIK